MEQGWLVRADCALGFSDFAVWFEIGHSQKFTPQKLAGAEIRAHC